MSTRKNVIIMGAAGRDFHNFNLCFREDPSHLVCAFTAYQIPGIAGRIYPRELAGPLYPLGIPIYDESTLPELIRKFDIDEVVFSYSDVRHVDVMHRAALVNALGADFRLMGMNATTLVSRKPVIAVCAVRTGCGKSQTARAVSQLLHERGMRAAVIRHPMPYDPDLNSQRCQRFGTLADLDRYRCTIEEREEYELHIEQGTTVFAGVDYQLILDAAEREADVIIWDGGNNDTSFIRADLYIVVTDPHRPGHEMHYYPGETNLRLADVIVVNKVNTAGAEAVQQVLTNVQVLNPDAKVIRADSVVSVIDPAAVRGKRVLVVEDGPTLTHGEMSYGAGLVAAKQCGAAEIVDPRPYAVGSIREVFARYTHLRDVLPAMGYGPDQIKELNATIERVPCDVILVGTPLDLSRLITTRRPMIRVRYQLDDFAIGGLGHAIDSTTALKSHSPMRDKERVS